jgi:aspartate aminotransferase-like enzyme
MLPPTVREALSQPAIYHRGAEFAELLGECERGLQTLLGTRQPVVMLTCSGTGAVEAIIVNTLSPGDRVLVVEGGKFGQRMGEIAAAYGAVVTSLEVAPGQAAQPAAVAAALGEGDYRALLFVLSETSTGVRQPAGELARVAREAGVLSLMDAVSGIGAMEVAMDEWGLTAVAGGSQKALMLPPGLACAALSDEGQQVARTAQMVRFYLDLPRAIAAQSKGQTPYTPNVNLLAGLRAALRLIEGEGLAAFRQRHQQLARACRKAAAAAGLRLLAADAVASEVVTAIWSPANIEVAELVKRLQQHHGIVISGGQDSLKGRIFRLGHLGAIRRDDLLRTWKALGAELNEMGYACDTTAVAAAVQTACDEQSMGFAR